MKTSLSFIVFALCWPQVQSANADCSDVRRQAAARHSALVAAKETFQREAIFRQKKEFSAEVVAESIASYTKMKKAMDEEIETLTLSATEGCFGKDADRWISLIPELRRESEAFGKDMDRNLQTLRDMRAAAPTGQNHPKSPLRPLIRIYLRARSLISRRMQLIIKFCQDYADSGDCGRVFRLIADSDSDRSRTAFR